MLSNTFSLLAVVGPGIYLNALLPIDGRIKNHFYEASTHAALTCFLGFKPKASLFMQSLLRPVSVQVASFIAQLPRLKTRYKCQ